MDVTSASAQSLYAYQSAVAGSNQASAVFQALTQAYTANSGSTSGDDLADLVGQANAAPLVPALYTQSGALKNGTAGAAAIVGLQAQPTVEGLDSTAAANLLSGLSSDGGDNQGFDGALSNSGALATAAALAQQTYGAGTLSSDARTLAAANAAAAGTSTGSPTAAYVSQAAATAQLSALNNTFTLLA